MRYSGVKHSKWLGGSNLSLVYSTMLFLLMVALGWRVTQLRAMVVHKTNLESQIWMSDVYLSSLRGTQLLEQNAFKALLNESLNIGANVPDRIVILVFRREDCRLCLREVAALNGIRAMEVSPIEVVALCLDCTANDMANDALITRMTFPVHTLHKSQHLEGSYSATPYRIYVDSSAAIQGIIKLDETLHDEEEILRWVVELDRRR